MVTQLLNKSTKIHYRVHKSQPLDRTLNLLHPVHILSFIFNIILLSKWSLLVLHWLTLLDSAFGLNVV